MSHTRMDLSSEFDTMMSWRAWNMTHDTLLRWPRSVSTSQALVSFMRQSFTCLSSAPLTMSGRLGWNAAQFTPRSWPSRTYLTTASPPPKRSEFIWPSCMSSSGPWLPGAALRLRRPEMSHTRTV